MNTNDPNINDEKLVSHVRDALDDSVNRIDAETSQRIVTARKQALSNMPKKFSLPKLFTAAASALSIFIAVVIVNSQFNQSAVTDDHETIEIAATQDSAEIYEELEFYTWLIEEDVTS